MSTAHNPGGQCDECEGSCLARLLPLHTPVKTVEWSCHAPTTIKDARGVVVAECSGHGRSCAEDAATAAEIVRRMNAHDALLEAAQAFVAWAAASGLQPAPDSPVGKARAAVALVTGRSA